MSSAGFQLVAGRIPGERLATTTRTSTTSTFTAETQVDSVTAPLVSGRTYRVRWVGRVQSSVADGYARGRIRQDNSSGTQATLVQTPTSAAANQSFPMIMETEYVAASTADKTFVATVVRQAGTGNLSCFADANTPNLFYVEYVSG